MYKNNTEKINAYIILVYATLTRFITSLYSFRFDKHVMEVDGACFFDVGKAIIDGRILYKEVFDHKTPYIYFINGIASLIDFNHIGLFIVEVLVLFFSIYYIYKFILLFFSSALSNDSIQNDDFIKKTTSDTLSVNNPHLNFLNTVSLIGAFFMATIFSIRDISFGYSRTEGFAVALILPSLYICYKYFFISDDIDKQKNKMFIIGILAGLTFMINIKAVTLFMPFAISILIINVRNKNYEMIFRHLILGLAGVLVSILPYIIYVFLTDSLNDMLYALIDTNIAYAKSKVAMSVVRANDVLHYDPKDGMLATVIAFTLMNKVVMILIYISFLPMVICRYNPYLKLTVVLQYITAFLYIMFGGRLHTYYIFIMLPYILSIYIFLVFMILRCSKKFKNSKKLSKKDINEVNHIPDEYSLSKSYIKKCSIALLVVSAIATISVSSFMNIPALNKLVYNHMSRHTRMKEIVSSYNNYNDDLKVLAVGFSPEVYVYLDAKINYKYFITPSISYKEDRTGYMAQYNYIAKNDPDIIVISEYQSLQGFPTDLRNQIKLILNSSYTLLGEVTTNANDGSYFIYSKN